MTAQQRWALEHYEPPTEPYITRDVCKEFIVSHANGDIGYKEIPYSSGMLVGPAITVSSHSNDRHLIADWFQATPDTHFEDECRQTLYGQSDKWRIVSFGVKDKNGKKVPFVRLLRNKPKIFDQKGFSEKRKTWFERNTSEFIISREDATLLFEVEQGCLVYRLDTDTVSGTNELDVYIDEYIFALDEHKISRPYKTQRLIYCNCDSAKNSCGMRLFFRPTEE